MSKCIFCGSKDITIEKNQETYEYKGHSFEVDLFSTQCGQCGEQYISPEQIKESDAIFLALRKKVDKILTPEQVKEIRTCLSLTQEDASLIFGGGPRSFGKYERAEVNMSISMNKLMLVTRDVPGVFDYLVAIAGMKKPPTTITNRVKRGFSDNTLGMRMLDYLEKESVVCWSSDYAANDTDEYESQSISGLSV